MEYGVRKNHFEIISGKSVNVETTFTLLPDIISESPNHYLQLNLCF